MQTPKSLINRIFLCIGGSKGHNRLSHPKGPDPFILTVADPGFPVGGVDLVGGAPTPEAVTFRTFCMSKRKNLDPWGRAPGMTSLDPP